MKLSYVGFKAFIRLKNPFSDWARQRRMQRMLRLANIHSGMSVLDVGGGPAIWNFPFIPGLDITILNLPGNDQNEALPVQSAAGGGSAVHGSQHRFRYVEGDGCNIAGIDNRSFDFVFSNSVIEHVGGPQLRAAFAAEIRRVGKAYWVQTPAIWFPIEAHTGMPFWWFYPHRLRESCLRRWRRLVPAWTEMVESTTVVERTELERLFPESHIVIERVLGITKSYSAIYVPVDSQNLSGRPCLVPRQITHERSFV